MDCWWLILVIIHYFPFLTIFGSIVPFSCHFFGENCPLFFSPSPISISILINNGFFIVALVFFHFLNFIWDFLDVSRGKYQAKCLIRHLGRFHLKQQVSQVWLHDILREMGKIWTLKPFFVGRTFVKKFPFVVPKRSVIL